MSKPEAKRQLIKKMDKYFSGWNLTQPERKYETKSKTRNSDRMHSASHNMKKHSFATRTA